MRGSMSEEFRKSFERKHVGVKEGACFLVDGPLQPLLGR